MGHTVLIIDDSVLDRTSLEQILVAAGYRVLLAESGEQALEIARDAQPDLVLVDVTMPDLDGFATTRHLKDDASTSHIPVVFVSNRLLKADMAWGRILGARGYIAKPYTAEQVLAQLKELL